ncbi:hypothetical protein [Pseudoduganella lurida]|nr:hypothetical protein [Pseudoduganella lurida]
MSIASKHLVALAMLAASITNPASAADRFAVTTATLQCGATRYVLASTCRPGKDETELNTCKPQVLTVSHAGKERKATLPELGKALTRETGKAGTLKNLFVVQWGCGRRDAKGGENAVLYYSVGGGNADYSEAFVVYDEAGVVIEDARRADYKAALQDGMDRLKPVRSIMPR